MVIKINQATEFYKRLLFLASFLETTPQEALRMIVNDFYLTLRKDGLR